jgi:hypothetical protein
MLFFLPAILLIATIYILFTKRRIHALWLIPLTFIAMVVGGSSISQADRDRMRVAEGERLQARFEADEAARKAREEREAAAKIEQREAELRQAARCRQDLQCWADKNMASATRYCVPMIEARARVNYRWTAMIFKFSQYRWINQNAGTVTYLGDEIEMQNGLGNWVRHAYQCEFNTDTYEAKLVNIRPGRV